MGLHALKRGEVPGLAGGQVNAVGTPVVIAVLVLNVQAGIPRSTVRVSVLARPWEVARAAPTSSDHIPFCKLDSSHSLLTQYLLKYADFTEITLIY